jgi:serine/threonine-protein kinase HipA
MIRLTVWITLPDCDRIQCGEIVCLEPDSRGRIQGAFRYTPRWLMHPKCFALDPLVLPLSEDEFTCDRPTGIFAVFEDSLPDDWGRRLLVRKARLARNQQALPHLLRVLNGSALGALSYFPADLEPVERNYATLLELEDLVAVALDYQSENPQDDDGLQMLFAAASSPGGARPKALVRTDDGAQWIAKFPSNKDTLAMVPIEAATLSLAAEAGLQVPRFFVEQCGQYPVLLVKRFDITPLGGRRHMLSFQTLMQAQGYYTLGYADLFEPLRKITSKPKTALAALYRHMVFNALIGNTDDHLKNFCLLHDDTGFFLSPAFDLLPDTAERREHVLNFPSGFYYPGLNELIKLGKRLGIRNAPEIAIQVREGVLNWKQEFEKWAVPPEDSDRLSFGIENRLKKDRNLL